MTIRYKLGESSRNIICCDRENDIY